MSTFDDSTIARRGRESADIAASAIPDVMPDDAKWIRADPSGFWRGWLTNASNDAAGLRRWLFWIWWTRERSPSDRITAVCNLAARPVFALKGALIEVLRYGTKVAELHGVPKRRQFLDIMRIQLISRLSPVSYYVFQLYLPERRHGLPEYFKEIGQLLQLLHSRLPATPDRRIFRAKRLFGDWCREQGLPTVDNLLEVSGDDILFRTTRPTPAGDLFSKPSDASLGMGVEMWRYDPADDGAAWVGQAGRFAFTALEQYLKRRSLEWGRPFVLQPRLVNHPAIRALGNGALSTLRVMTVRDDVGAVTPLLSVLRIATGETPADNFDLGGIAVPVDLATGRCGTAITKRGDYPIVRMSNNPDTDIAIEGFELPFWREALALAVRAHTSVEYQTPVIGWDIAILADGPVLIEPNGLPCSYLAQMPTGLPLGETHFAQCMVSALKLAFRLH